LHRKALFLSFFGWQSSQFLFSCKQLVTVIPANLCRREKPFGIAGCSRHSLYKLPAQMGPAAAAGNIRYLVVASIAVGMQVSTETFQKLLWVFAAASGLVLVQNNGRQPIHAGTVNPHVRLGLSGLAVLFEDLHHRLICMQNLSLQKLFPHGIPQRL